MKFPIRPHESGWHRKDGFPDSNQIWLFYSVMVNEYCIMSKKISDKKSYTVLR